MSKEDDRQIIIDNFVNSIYLYDDRIIFIFNYKTESQIVNLEDINCSDMSEPTAPFFLEIEGFLLSISFLHLDFQGVKALDYLEGIFMKRCTTIQSPAAVRRTTPTAAQQAFLQHCKIRNLAPQTLIYYTENLRYFFQKVQVNYVDEISQDTFDNFLGAELDDNKKVTSLNSRMRGLRVFFKFCAEREYMSALHIKLMKEDAEIKEPYTHGELQRLLKRPCSNRWVEWRTWATVNYLMATGNRASTVVNVKIKDIDFDANTIFLSTVKNRRQQIIPLSKTLKAVLTDYLQTWEHTPENYLFPSNEGTQLVLRSLQGAVRDYNISRGVSKTSIHLFRHCFAKNFILAGGGMVQLQALLGHSSLDMTRHYVNIYGLDLQRDFDRLNPLDTFWKTAANQ